MTENFFRSNVPLTDGNKAATPADIPEVRISAESLARCSTPESRSLIPYEYALKHSLLPLGLVDLAGRKALSLAAPAALTPAVQAEIKFITGFEARCCACAQQVLERALEIAYKGDDKLLEESATKLSLESSRSCGPGTFSESKPAKGVVPQFLETLLEYAFSRNASDIHITPRHDGTFVMLRVHGRLLTHDKPLCSRFLHAQLVNRIKVLANLGIAPQQSVHEGRFSLKLRDSAGCVRVSILPTVHGDKVVLRLHGNLQLRELAELGFRAEVSECLQGLVDKPGGLVLFTGPTGSGKSSSMYAVLAELKKRNLNLASAEDPVELIVPGVNQTNVDPKRGFNYAECIRALMRQDPDCILLGEIRDRESAQSAFQAARTGHMVISSIHGASIADVLLRLEEFGVTHIAVAHGLRMIMNQRLVAALCPCCKVIDLGSSNAMKSTVFKAVGCRQCDYSGFSGRLPIAECFYLEDEARVEILMNGVKNIIAEHVKCGHDTELRSDFERLLRNGAVSPNSFTG